MELVISEAWTRSSEVQAERVKETPTPWSPWQNYLSVSKNLDHTVVPQLASMSDMGIRQEHIPVSVTDIHCQKKSQPAVKGNQHRD